MLTVDNIEASINMLRSKKHEVELALSFFLWLLASKSATPIELIELARSPTEWIGDDENKKQFIVQKKFKNWLIKHQWGDED